MNAKYAQRITRFQACSGSRGRAAGESCNRVRVVGSRDAREDTAELRFAFDRIQPPTQAIRYHALVAQHT